MAFSLRKTSDNGSVGLDIDGRYAAAVMMTGQRVTKAVSAELPPGAMSDGEVSDPDGIAAALKPLIANAGLPRRVRLGVANQQIVVRLIELPRIAEGSERDAAVRFQAAEAIAMPLDEAVLDYQVVGESETEDGARRMQVVVVAARRSMVEKLVAAVRGAGLKPEGIDLDAFALVRALSTHADPEGDARVLCHLGGVTNLAIASGDVCLFCRPLSTSWAGEESLDALADEIRLSLDYYMAQQGARPASQLVVSGPGSQDVSVVEALGARLGLAAVSASPLGELEPLGVSPDDDPRLYTVAAGLALGAQA